MTTKKSEPKAPEELGVMHPDRMNSITGEEFGSDDRSTWDSAWGQPQPPEMSDIRNPGFDGHEAPSAP